MLPMKYRNVWNRGTFRTFIAYGVKKTRCDEHGLFCICAGKGHDYQHYKDK